MRPPRWASACRRKIYCGPQIHGAGCHAPAPARDAERPPLQLHSHERWRSPVSLTAQPARTADVGTNSNTSSLTFGGRRLLSPLRAAMSTADVNFKCRRMHAGRSRVVGPGARGSALLRHRRNRTTRSAAASRSLRGEGRNEGAKSIHWPIDPPLNRRLRRQTRLGGRGQCVAHRELSFPLESGLREGVISPQLLLVAFASVCADLRWVQCRSHVLHCSRLRPQIAPWLWTGLGAHAVKPRRDRRTAARCRRRHSRGRRGYPAYAGPASGRWLPQSPTASAACLADWASASACPTPAALSS